MIANASRVVRARVLRARSERGAGGRIYTVTTLEVLEDFSGENDSIIEVRELGGVVGNDFLWVGGGVSVPRARRLSSVSSVPPPGGCAARP